MKAYYILALFMGLSISFAHANTTPQFDRASELCDIVKNKNVWKVIMDARYNGKSSGMIDSIGYVSNFNFTTTYSVTSGACTLRVRLVTILAPPGMSFPSSSYDTVVDSDMNCQ